MDLVYISYDDKYWSKIVFSNIPDPMRDLMVKVTDLELSSFYLKVFRTPLFPNPVVYLFHVWHEDRCWSKILCSTIPKPVHDLKIKVTDLQFLYWSLYLSFYNVCFCEVFNGLIHVWHGNRKLSKILYGTQKVTDSEFFIELCDKCFTISVFFFFCIAFNGFYSIVVWRQSLV